MTMTTTYAGYFETDQHALYCGWILGVALRSGLQVSPVVDDAGNYLNQIRINIAAATTITVVVPPPPPDWKLT